MKNLNKIQIKKGRIISNDDLKKISGGDDGGEFIHCFRDYPQGGPCYIVGVCLTSHLWCDLYCPGSYASVCV
jgi:hypothetical protein